MIGVFGGTFDPIHFGHLRPMLEVRDSIGLEQVRIIPCGQPPHREGPAAAAEQRWAMVQLATRGVRGFVPDDREMRRKGPSYMVDTLTSLREDFAGKPLCLVLGMDSFLGLTGWHRWQHLTELAHLVVMTRPGWEWSDDGELGRMVEDSLTGNAGDLADSPSGRTCFCEVSALDISSTRIRELIRDGRSVRFLLPETVREYLETNAIYK